MRIITTTIAALVFALFASTAAANYAAHAEAKRFIDEMVERHGFERPALEALFADAHRRDDILKAIARPAESKPWHEYRPIFLTESRIDGGATFWAEHRELLERAEAAYGVPPEMIIAIIGVETRYGRYTGRHRVIDALSTLAFDYPKRAPFFRGELEQFLLMAREEGFDPREPKGSYAGAMGWGQFIPSSFRAYAVDFDGDGKRDLWGSPADIIGSVANYFRRHGWRPGEQVALPARVEGDAHRPLLDEGLAPKRNVAEIAALGVAAEGEAPADAPATLIRLRQKGGPEYWLGLHNFYVITRYNHSPLYAMAAWQLSREIRERSPRELADAR